jgi:chitinase
LFFLFFFFFFEIPALALPLIAYIPFALAALLVPSHRSLLVRSLTSCESVSAKSCQLIATSWYAGWHGADFPPASVNWDKDSSVRYVFVCVSNILRFNLHLADHQFEYRTTTPNASVIYLKDSDKKLLPQFVKAAHQNIGSFSAPYAMHFSEHIYITCRCNTFYRWLDHSQYFSTAMGSAANGTAFVHAVLSLVKTYDLDGIGFEYAIFSLSVMSCVSPVLCSWEYPGKQGIGCNTISLHDSANFLSFLQELSTVGWQIYKQKELQQG